MLPTPVALFVPGILVPDLEAGEQSSQENLLPELGLLSKEGGDQDSPLTVKRAFLSSRNELAYERSVLRLNLGETEDFCFDLLPVIDGIHHQALVQPSDDDRIRLAMLQDLAELGGNSQPAFGIQASNGLTSEVGFLSATDGPLNTAHWGLSNPN